MSWSDIQTAIDKGGTVYFKYGDYRQLLNPVTVDPKLPLNHFKGFNIGRLEGADVSIIGLSGPNGARPKIHGGLAPLRYGKLDGFGLNSYPVDFTAENLEIVEPELGNFGRHGIWVNTQTGSPGRMIGELTINDCRITIKGLPADPARYSMGIWVRLANLPDAASGTKVNITNNWVYGDYVAFGIGCGQFRAESSAFTAPKFLVDGNHVDVTNLQAATSPPFPAGQEIVPATALGFHGNASYSKVTNNKVSGGGAAPGFKCAAMHYLINRTNPSTLNAVFAGNDLSEFAGDYQLYAQSGTLGNSIIDCIISGNTFGPAKIASVYLPANAAGNHVGPHPNYGPGNVFGPVLLSHDGAGTLLTLGAYVDNGKGNICEHNDFRLCGVKGWDAPPYVGCIHLTGLSQGARVYEHPQLGTKYFPPGSSMCNQIVDGGVASLVQQWDTLCAGVHFDHFEEIRARWAGHEQSIQPT